ncbi:MAG: 3-hydroxyacyl-ACP dehydratase FabZ [Desulfobacterales bacterium]|jgi:beta-hydroxyacyl-ACP dehydratase FabZ|nr:3-hydroxyacyl-ACP dehydratase FabZ [Desulfobacteraceae bacterium]MBT4364404.1 3-hydroxyacyl-ACP dehydratase FabZ [Desulfobacteraceae bacterium]MBT7085701.1 3-hydroxyacyl-ACP dehydratase FabZ [Desulfobacterales bacterium]MBT7696236.1 3-hydroxyacyl-ACP dehydratase FabZ [Desulfobacterales bacterium]
MEKDYDIQAIMDLLPHRYPFLLVDRITELVKGEKVVGLKNVTINEPHFQGHFPGRPIMPGVLIIEAMAQVGGVLAFESAAEDVGGLIYFMSIDKVKFRQPVFPGDQLILETKVLKLKRKIIKMSGTASVDGKVVTEAEFMATIGG